MNASEVRVTLVNGGPVHVAKDMGVNQADGTLVWVITVCGRYVRPVWIEEGIGPVSCLTCRRRMPT